MLDIDSFDAVFGAVGKNHYPTHLVSQVQAAQDQLGDKLFVHQLLDTLNIPASHLYPPKNAKEFRELHRLVVSAACATVQKQSLLYYLLKDCSLVAKDNDAAADAFCKSIALPQKYKIAMQGFWSMDKLRFEDAIEHLTHPLLKPPVFGTEVLATLLRVEEDGLALAYYTCTRPPLLAEGNAQLLDAYFRMLCRVNLTEAFFFMRRETTHVPDADAKPKAAKEAEREKEKRQAISDLRQSLLESLIDAALSLPAGEEKRQKTTELVELPLDEQEEGWFKDYLTSGSGRSLDLAQDTLAMRLLATGQYGQALDVLEKRKVSRAAHDGVSWEGVAEGLKRAVGERRQFDCWTV